MSYTGRTRFEDSTRLPLGVIVNGTSFAAKVLTQVGLHLQGLAGGQ